MLYKRFRLFGEIKIMNKKVFTYKSAAEEIIAAMEIHESVAEYSDLRAAVTHYLQTPETIPQGIPDSCKKIIEEYRPKIADDFFRTVPFPPPKTYDFKFIDLFAGIGGFRLAFQKNGGKCVFSSEWNEFAQKTYEANYGEVPYGDIHAIDKQAIPFFDVLCAGFPCQPFSLAGVSKKNSLGRAHGFADQAQGTLFFEIAELLKLKRPPAFMLENVKNLEAHDGGKTFEVIRRTLENELGYIVNWKIVDGSKWVPQHRERIFIVGYNPDLINITKEEIIIPSEPEPGFKRKELKSIIRSDVTDCTLGPGTWASLERHKKHHEEAGHGFGYGLHTLPIKDGEITRTISARYSKDGAEILIEQPGNRPRHLTVGEAMQLQGYDPEKFVFPVSNSQAFKQIGNSVVWPAISSCAAQIAIVLKERRKV